jgi:hypothetical protein
MRRGWAIVGLIGLLAIAGCGRESHPNDPRPAIATEVTVAISDGDVSVQPSEVGVAGSDQGISQNAGQKEPTLNSNVPVIVSFTVANLTNTETKLQIDGPRNFTSNAFIANGSGNFKASLPTGNYRISADKLPGASAGSFQVGPDRSSSQNDLLLP